MLVLASPQWTNAAADDLAATSSATMGDMRALVSDLLGCASVYASDDAAEVRCLVEPPTGDASGVQEWLIRRLPRDGVAVHKTSSPADSMENESPQVESLDVYLDAVLHLPTARARSWSRVDDRAVGSGLHVLDGMFEDIPRYTVTQSRAEILHGLCHRHAKARRASFGRLRGVIETTNSEELAVFEYEQRTLQDLLRFNRSLLDDEDAPDAVASDMKRRFLVYQLCEFAKFVHKNQLTASGCLIPSRIWLADSLWARFGFVPRVLPSEEADIVHGPPASVEQLVYTSPTERWCRGDLSNFEYLMMLNAAAGRRMIDSVFHPVLPWVSDFSSRSSGWRDLSKSKFRLNKGDNQLDRNYQSSVIPHHITESLSEITYYIYMARRTPMAVLRHVVRRNFQPREYPQTMERMFHWTPDECIPEFFTDPTVFASMHGGSVMPDMVLPDWCENAHDFVQAHRAMLESEEVSSSLHTWIDLNFGVCLSGKDAIRNKNVPLKSKAGVGSVRKSPGFVQLFSQAHPERQGLTKCHSTKSFPDGRSLHKKGHASPDTRVGSEESLRLAVKIAEDALNDPSLAPAADHPAQVQLQDILSPPQAEKKGLSSSFVKLKKMSKGRPKLHSGHDSSPQSPPVSRETGTSRSPTVARFAHAIPRFFGGDSPTLQPGMHPGFSSVATVSTLSNAASVSFGSGSGSHEGHSFSKTSTTLAAQNVGPNLLHSSMGAHASPGSHILRDLWHQLSRPDDEDSNEAGDDGNSLSDADWMGTDYDSLDETSLLLLRASPSIRVPSEPALAMNLHDYDRPSPPSIAPDPTYTPLQSWNMEFAEDYNLAASDIMISDDVFSLGCTIAEIYTGRPLFSKSSLLHYYQSYANEGTPSHRGRDDQTWQGQQIAVSQLHSVPIGIKNMILKLVHPHPRCRILAWLPGRLKQTTVSIQPRLPMVGDVCFSYASLVFPASLQMVYRYSANLHESTNWAERLRITRTQLPALVRLPDDTFRVLTPSILSYLNLSSYGEGGGSLQACSATVFLLKNIAERLGRGATRLALVETVLSLYETADVPPVLRLCLSSPDILKIITTNFGPVKTLRHFLPVLIDWLSTPSLYRTKNSDDRIREERPSRSRVLFSAEAANMLAVCFGELASSDGLGPAMAVKYILPSLLSLLGKIQPKWTRFSEERSLVREELRPSSESFGARAAYGGKNGDGIHVAYAAKHVLYENHFVADAILLVCRELPASVVADSLLPHLWNVTPRLIELAESVSSVRIEGVPDDLAREVYVSLRVLRHVVRSVDEQTVRQEFLDKHASSFVDLLNRIQPPFLHPRTVDGVVNSIADTPNFTNSRPILHRHNSAPVPASVRRSKQIMNHLAKLQDEQGQDLRAFTAVGVARTVTGVLQKVGPELAVTATGILQSINAFLVRCAAIYSELEVTDFQWRMASEVVSEFCSPLRALLGAEKFANLFPSVQASSVLQLLLLPSAQTQPFTARSKEAKQYLRQTTIATSTGRDAEDFVDLSDGQVTMLSKKVPELLESAYRSARLNGIKTPSFLHVPLRSGSAWSQDLNEEIFIVQEERKKRRALSTSAKVGGESAWLRQRVHSYFVGRHEDPSMFAAIPGSGSGSDIGSSWSVKGEVRFNMRAHSSATRSISVDQDEDFIVTASKNGSCRSWRLSSYPGQAVSTVHIDSTNLLSARSLEDGKRAVAISPASIHVWDICTSHVMFRIPFGEDNVTSCTPLRVLPYRHYEDFAESSRGTTSREASVIQGSADFAVTTVRKLHLVDARAAPRVVADWRVDARDTTYISSSALLSTSSNPAGVVATGTTTGQLFLTDKRVGKCVAQWQALHESRVVKIVQYAPSYLLVVGSDREARVWKIDDESRPRLRMIITNVPEGVRGPQVSVQAYTDSVILYVASAAKVYITRLLHDASPEANRSEIVTVRLESWSLQDNFTSPSGPNGSGGVVDRSGGVNSPERSRLSRTKISAQSMAVLPLRQVFLTPLWWSPQKSGGKNANCEAKMDAPTGTEKIVTSAATGAFFGAAAGTIESVWSIPMLGAKLPKFSVQFKHIGGRALIFGAVAGLFATTEYTAETVRQKSTPANAAIGGAVAGLVPGIVAKNARVGAVSSIVAAAAMATASYWAESSVSPFEKYAAARESERS